MPAGYCACVLPCVLIRKECLVLYSLPDGSAQVLSVVRAPFAGAHSRLVCAVGGAFVYVFHGDA